MARFKKQIDFEGIILEIVDRCRSGGLSRIDAIREIQKNGKSIAEAQEILRRKGV